MDATSHMAKMGLVTRVEILWRNTATGPCKPCLKGNQSHHRICKVTATCTDCALGHVFLDTCGLLATQLQNGHNHLITLIDDHPHKASTYGPRDKLQVRQALKAFTFQAKPSTGQEVKILCSNGSGKHMASHLQEVLHHTAPLHDTLPTHALDFFTPKEALSGNKLDVF